MVYNREKLIENFDWDDPMTSLFIVYQKIGNTNGAFDADTIIDIALRLTKQIPPDLLL